MRSPLARFLPETQAATPAELDRMRAAAWRKRGAILVTPDDDVGEWLRAAIEAWAARRWGRRMGERS